MVSEGVWVAELIARGKLQKACEHLSCVNREAGKGRDTRVKEKVWKIPQSEFI